MDIVVYESSKILRAYDPRVLQSSVDSIGVVSHKSNYGCSGVSRVRLSIPGRPHDITELSR